MTAVAWGAYALFFIYYESRTKVHIKNKNKNYAYDTHK